MPETSQNQKSSDPNARVRTMQADLADAIRKGDSLLHETLTAPQGPRTNSFGEQRLLMFALGFLLFLGIAGGGFWYYTTYLAKPQAPTIPTTPAPFFFFERTKVIQPATPAAASALFKDSITEFIPQNTFVRVVPIVGDGTAPYQFLDFHDFVSSLGGSFSADIVSTFSEEEAQYFYFARDGTMRDFGVALLVDDGGAALDRMRLFEPRMEKGLTPVFLEDARRGTTTPFRDASWRNIGYRWQAVDEQGDRGIAYLLFPARSLMIIANSEAIVQAIIERLLQTS